MKSTCCVSLLNVSTSAFILVFPHCFPPICCVGSGCIRRFSPLAAFPPHPTEDCSSAGTMERGHTVLAPQQCRAVGLSRAVFWPAFDQEESACSCQVFKSWEIGTVCAVKRNEAQGCFESTSCPAFLLWAEEKSCRMAHLGPKQTHQLLRRQGNVATCSPGDNVTSAGHGVCGTVPGPRHLGWFLSRHRVPLSAGGCRLPHPSGLRDLAHRSVSLEALEAGAELALAPGS